MQVEVIFPDVPAGPVQVRISRTSPGRYALHEFSRTSTTSPSPTGRARPIVPDRPNLHQWDVTGHDGIGPGALSRLRRPR